MANNKPIMFQCIVNGKIVEGPKCVCTDKSKYKDPFPNWDEFYSKWADRSWSRQRSPIKESRGKLTDAQVIWARENIGTYGYNVLASKMNVSLQTIENAVKGQTYRHLNMKHKPQR